MNGEVVRYREWVLEADAGATAAAYLQVDSPTQRCNCRWCRNFVAWRVLGYPRDLSDLLGRCGLDPFRESDVYQQGLQPDEGTVLYRWFFFFRGRVISGPQAWILAEDTPDPVFAVTSWELDLVELTGSAGYFALGFGDSPSRIKAEGQNVPPSLRVGPTVQVELRAHVPWTISESMPKQL